MLRIENKNISFNRGEEIQIKLTSNVNFKDGDKIKLRVTEEKNVSNVLFEKDFYSIPGSNIILIIITPDESREFVPIKNKPIKYWYEIELNEKITLLGYDKYGPKVLTVNPEAGAE